MLHCPMLQLSLVSPTVIYANTERQNINRINKTGWNTFLYLKWETDESPKIVQFKHWTFWTLEFMYSVELYELQGLYGAVLEVKKYVSVLSLFTCRCISWCYSVKKCEKWPNIVRWGVCALQTDLNTNVCPITALKKFISYIWVTKVTIFGQQLLICMTLSKYYGGIIFVNMSTYPDYVIKNENIYSENTTEFPIKVTEYQQIIVI